ncbi:PREDICTED: zinc finger protein 469 [Chrysochloris asiatica]|uniref:Zinc finger protein 469 n=1 Tax=Chrysochloris asiatica TaxID=185453 RepID=A0A9B0TAQ5_CHRAS|nr:PREDICTED: zinc finger protein 469 [Chrysochloris asiatica]
MPAEQPLRALPPATTGRDSGRTSQPPKEGSTQVSLKGTKEVGSEVQATEPPKSLPRQASEVGPRTLSSSPWQLGKGGAPQGSPGKGHTQTRVRRPGREHGGPQQLYRLSITSTKNETPEGRPGTGAPLTPSLPRAKSGPPCKELNSHRCFPETPSHFTSTDYTSPSPTPGPPPLRAPRTQGPSRPASYTEFPAGRADVWSPASENSFPAANFGVPPTKPETFPEGGGPSPGAGVGPFQCPFPVLHGAGPKAFAVDRAQHKYTDDGAFTFHPTPHSWPKGPVGPTQLPPPPLLPPYSGPASSLDAPQHLSRTLSPPGAVPHTPSPFPGSLHKSLTPALPERPPSAHDGAASPRGPLNPLPPMHFLGKPYNSPGPSSLGTSPGPLDKELAVPRPAPTPRPQLWEGASEVLPLVDPTTAPYPAVPPAPPAPARGMFFEGQRLCLPQSPPLPWSPVLPAPGSQPTPMELLNQLPYSTRAPEWPGNSQGALGGPSHTAGTAEKLTVPRNGSGTPNSSPSGLFPYSNLQDPSTQPLFFGVTPPQASPRGTPGLPLPRGVGASPSESPLPSPATTAASSSSCSSLSPLSSSPANPSSEEGQLPGPLGPSAFFHPLPAHPQEGSSAFPPSEPLTTLPIHYQPEPKAFPFPEEALGADGALESLQEVPFTSVGPDSARAALGGYPQEPLPYSAHHFPLSSANLDQLDVLLTCRQCEQNFCNLASFLQHRQFCGPLPRAPADTHHPSLLGHTKLAGFLSDGDVLQGLAATPLPLPASDLDLEDVAKLDSLITEALNGLDDPSQPPEIDSSFIDVFTDEDPLGLRVPSAGQTPKTKAGPTPEPRAQSLLPSPTSTLKPRAPSPGAKDCTPCHRPETRSQGQVPPEAEGARPPRRGKRFKLLREGLDAAQGPGESSRAIGLRPRRKGRRIDSPPHQARTPRAPRGHADTGGQTLNASPLPTRTQSSRCPRLPRSKLSRRRTTRSGRWSKELIHKIVRQKNELRDYDYTSEAKEDQGPGAPPGPPQQATRAQVRTRLSCQGGRRGEKRKDVEGTPGPREEQNQWTPKKLVRQEARLDRDSRVPGALGAEPQGETVPRGASTETPEEKCPLLRVSRETTHAELAGEAPTGSSSLVEDSHLSLSNGEVKGSSPPAPEQPQPGREDPSPPQSSGIIACMKQRGHTPPSGADAQPLLSPDQGPPPKSQPGEGLMPTTSTLNAAHPAPTTLLVKSCGLGWEPLDSEGDPVGVSVAKKGPQPCGRPCIDFLLGSKMQDGSCLKDLGSKPSAQDGPVHRVCLCQDNVDTRPLIPKSPRNVSQPTVTKPSDTQALLTLESTSLFSRLPVDGFHPPIYDTRLAHKDNHVPPTCTTPLLRRPLLEPQCTPEKVWSVLGDMCPEPLGGRSCGQRYQGEGPSVASLHPLPGKGQEHGDLESSTSEEELEVKRLVTELESQLQTSTAQCQAPMPPDSEPVGSRYPASGPLLTDGLASLGRSSPCQDHQGMMVASEEGTRGDSASHPTMAVVLHPGVQEAPIGPSGPSHTAQPSPQTARDQKTEPTQAQRDHSSPPTFKLIPPPLDANGTTERSPDQEPWFPRSNETTRTHPSGETLMLHPPKLGGIQCPEPLEAGGPCQDAKLGTCYSPIAHSIPGMEGQAGGSLPLGAMSPSSSRHCHAPQKCSLGNKGSNSAEVQPEPVSPIASPLGQLRLLVTRATESKGGAQFPQLSKPSGPGGDGLDSSCVTHSQGTTACAVAGHPPETEADRCLGSVSQAKSQAPERQGQPSQWQPEEQGDPEELTSAKIKPGAALTRHAGGTDRLREQLEGDKVAWSPQYKAENPPSPTSPDKETSLLALTVTHGHDDHVAEKVARPGPRKWLPSARERSADPIRDPADCIPSTASASPQGTHGPEPLPREDPLSVLAGVQGKGRLLPASPSCGDPQCPQHLLAPPPTQTPLQRAKCTPGHVQCPAEPPPGRTSPCSPEGGPADNNPLVDALTGGQPDVSPAHGGHSSNNSIPRIQEEPRKVRLRRSPTHTMPSPPAKAVSLRGTSKAPRGPRVPTAYGTEVTRGLQTLDPRIVSPELHCASSDPLGPGEGQQVTAKPTSPCPREAIGSEVGEDCKSPGIGHSESHRHVPCQAPGGDPPCPQDSKQKSQGFQKKPQSSGHSHRTEGTSQASTPAVTCEVCWASFRSGPGLSRHKARKHRNGSSVAHQTGLSAHGAPSASITRTPGKKGRKTPGKDKSRPRSGQSFPEDSLGTETPVETRQGHGILGTPGSSPHPEPQTPDLLGQEASVMPQVPRPRKTGRVQDDIPRAKHTETRASQRQGRRPQHLPSDSKKSHQKWGKVSVKRFRKKSEASDSEESCPQVSPDVISDRPDSNPSSAIANYPARPSHRLSPEGEQEKDELQPSRAATPEPGVMGHVEETPHQAGRDAAILGSGRKPSQAARSRAADDGRGSKSWAGKGMMGTCKLSSEPQGASKSPSSKSSSPINCSPQGFLSHPEAGDHIQSSLSGASSPGLVGPLGLFDDETSFSQLFPLGDRLVRKKNPRVYGQRCGKKPKPPPTPEPHSKVGDTTPLCSTRLPTDLRDCGSPCLSPEELWENDASDLPEAFLVDSILSSKVPDIRPWSPGPSVWDLEQPEKGPSPSSTPTEEKHPDNMSEGLPELHRVPATWPGLELQNSPNETSSLGEMSPEPPSLEKEGCDNRSPENADMLPFPGLDFDIFSTKFEMEDLSLLESCEDPRGLPSSHFLNLQAGRSSQGLQGTRSEVAEGDPNRDPQTRVKRGSYKCRVCFRRFGGLGELDLHKMAHSPSPPPTCYMCVERRFGSRQLLREHLREKHGQSKAGLWTCGMCLHQVPDVWMYNEHLREHAVRFARRGHARTSLGDLSGCVEEGSLLPHFLNNIVGQVSLPHRGQNAIPKVNGGSPEAAREATATPKLPRANPSDQDGTLTPGGDVINTNVLAIKSPPNFALSSSNKAPPSLPSDHCSLNEPLLRATPVHADCKDPSRHCHHCGKQFPKPFKLQRHLAVHSPQRVFLCPQCPRVYAEHSQLRAHRSQEHAAQGEAERPATPLYACELCATVMRIIKRSFICSACNYTFAKKEQFDRHMDKHRRLGQQPFAFRGVRRPGAPGKKAAAFEGTLPSKRRRVTMPGSAPRSSVDGPQSLDSSPAPDTASPEALYPLFPEPALSTAQGLSQTQERSLDPEDGAPPDCPELLPPPLSPSSAAPAGGKGGREDEAPPDSRLPPHPHDVPPGAGSQDLADKTAPHLLWVKHRKPRAPHKCAPGPSLEDTPLIQREKLVPRSHMVAEGGPGGAPHKGGAAKARSTRGPADGKGLTAVAPPRKVLLSAATAEPARDTEDRPRSTPPKVKLDLSSQGSGDPRHGPIVGGGSQPQPASGQLQSETATTPGKPPCQGPSPPPAKPPPQAPAKGCSLGPQGGRELGPGGSLGPKESMWAVGGKRRGRAPGPTRSETLESLGRDPSVPDRPPRNPRKQAVPSRVPPANARLSSQRVSPGHGGFRRKREGLVMAAPEKRPPHGSPRRGRAVPPSPRALHTAESQSHLLSQLFGRRLTSFKIPLKREPSE